MSTLSVAEKLVRLGSTSKLMTLYGISATKRLSQNFIYDQNLLDSLIRHCIPSKITEKYRFEALQKEFLSEMDTKKLHEMIHQKNPQLCLQQIQDFLQYRNFAGKNLPPTAHQVQTFFSALQAKHPPPSLSSSPPTASQNPADFMADIILSSPFRQNIFVDIGAGPGGLTRSLLKYGAGHVIAIEPDGRFLPLLEHLRSVVGEERLTIVHSVYEKWEAEKMLFRVTERFEHLKGLKEAAKQDHSNPNARMGSVLKVVGNLPFSVATKLTSLHIDKLHSGSHVFGFCADTEFYFMYQLEVANKICGKAHELKDSKSMKKTNSNLHLTLNHSFETKFLQKISRSAFIPQPRVDAGFVRFLPNRYKQKSNFTLYSRFVFGLYENSRKKFPTTLNLCLKNWHRNRLLEIPPDFQNIDHFIETFHSLYFKNHPDWLPIRVFHFEKAQLDEACSLLSDTLKTMKASVTFLDLENC